MFFLGMCAVCLTIATACAVAGLWPVLPFAGLELAALGAALHVVGLRAEECEVISIRGDVVEVRKGRRIPEQRWRFQRAWAQVRLARSAHRWYPSRVTLGSHGREVELGPWLNDEEKERLVRELRRWLGNGARPIVAGGVDEF